IFGLDKRIGDLNTVYGLAFSASLKETKDLFVIKAPQYDYLSSSLLHEYVIGMYGTNRIRHLVPNFTYVFGYFECLPPILNDPSNGNLVSTWCTNNIENSVNYIIYENITNSESMFSYMLTATPKQFIAMYTQVLL